MKGLFATTAGLAASKRASRVHRFLFDCEIISLSLSLSLRSEEQPCSSTSSSSSILAWRLGQLVGGLRTISICLSRNRGDHENRNFPRPWPPLPLFLPAISTDFSLRLPRKPEFLFLRRAFATSPRRTFSPNPSVAHHLENLATGSPPRRRNLWPQTLAPSGRHRRVLCPSPVRSSDFNDTTTESSARNADGDSAGDYLDRPHAFDARIASVSFSYPTRNWILSGFWRRGWSLETLRKALLISESRKLGYKVLGGCILGCFIYLRDFCWLVHAKQEGSCNL